MPTQTELASRKKLQDVEKSVQPTVHYALNVKQVTKRAVTQQNAHGAAQSTVKLAPTKLSAVNALKDSAEQPAGHVKNVPPKDVQSALMMELLARPVLKVFIY